MLNNDEVIHRLESLTKLDIDAVRAYTQAIDRIDVVDIKAQLSTFRADHERHITDLSACIERLGGQAPKATPDLKGFFIEGFTTIRSMFGTESALKAMKGNEELTNRTYAKALELDLPDDVHVIVHKNREDERRHLEYIVECLNKKSWERAA